jgi:hypothetical protein
MQLVLRLAAPFERARFRPILGTSHLARAVPYVLRQRLHHGAAHDPGFDGCSIVDLFGLRVLDPELPRRVQRYLPRLTREAAAPWFPRLRCITPELETLAEAAAAAVATVDLQGNTPSVAAARRAAIQIAVASADIDDAAALLGLTVPAARRLRARPSDPLLVRAVRGQLALHTWLAERRARGLRHAGGLDEPPILPADRSEVMAWRLDHATSDPVHPKNWVAGRRAASAKARLPENRDPMWGR